MSAYEIHNRNVRKILNIKNSDIAHLLGKREEMRSGKGSQEPIDLKRILKKPSYIYSSIHQTQISSRYCWFSIFLTYTYTHLKYSIASNI